MNLSVISLNFKNAPVELRERLAVTPADTPLLLEELRSRCGVKEAMVLSTCNRVEFFFPDDAAGTSTQAVGAWLRTHAKAEAAELERASVTLTGRTAVTHLFRVASSLESMVIGEPQILGQVKEAFQVSVAHGCHGPFFNSLMPRVFQTAKRVRTETGIARFPVSISFAAVRLAEKIFESLAGKTVMIIGAGDMAELTAQHLLGAGIRRLLITNRTFANAVALAEKFQASAVQYDELETYLPDADIVISSTGARGFIIGPELARKAIRKRRGAPIFFIDIAVPRDVAPEVNQISNVYRYDIDDLQAVTDANKRERENEALKAQKIVEQEVQRYEQWLRSQSAVPAIKALRRRFQEIGKIELESALTKLQHLPPEDAERVQTLVRRLINKLLHTPSTRLKEGGAEINGVLYDEALVALFDLEPGGGDAGRGPTSAEAPRKSPSTEPAAGANVLHLPLSKKN